MHIPTFYRKAPVGARFLLASAAPQIVLIILLLANSIRLLENADRAHLENLIARNAGMLHAMTSAYSGWPGFGPLQDTLGELLAHAGDGLIYVCLGDNAGNILLSAGLPEQEMLHPPDIIDIGGGKIADLLDRPLVHVRHPLPLPRDETGFLQFGVSNTGLPATRQAIVRQGMLIALLVLLATLALSAAIGYVLIRRLQRLLTGSQAMAEGRLNFRLPVKGGDWLARLARHFNAMASMLRHDAMHDALTGLPNRALFIEHLRRALARQKRDERQRFAVLAINLERFHLINDSYSHATGNQLLCRIANHFISQLRSGDIAARLSGDQFAILLHGPACADEALQISRHLLDLPGFAAPGAHQVLHMKCRAGLAMSASGVDAETLLRDADSALQATRGNDSGLIQVFQASMHARMLSTLTLETELRAALAEKTLSVAYQPIVRLFDRRIASFEALIRWRHPLRGQIPPDVFIPLAESLDLIHELGMFVLHRSCLDILKWQRHSGSGAPPVSINLSARQLARASLGHELLEAIASHGLAPGCLRFEVTESLLTHPSDPNIETLRRLREAGIVILIDDFGVGYSALSYLHTLPCDIVKLDGSFVAAIATDERPRAIVRHSIDLAHDLSMTVVAESIEQEDQFRILRAIGCDFGQGHLFSKPLPASEACRLLRARKGESREQ